MIIQIARILQYYKIFVENHWSVKTTTIFQVHGGNVKSKTSFSSSLSNCSRSISRSLFLSKFILSRSCCLSISYFLKMSLRSVTSGLSNKVVGGLGGGAKVVVWVVRLRHGGMEIIWAWTGLSVLHLFLRKWVIRLALLNTLAGLFCPILSVMRWRGVLSSWAGGPHLAGLEINWWLIESCFCMGAVEDRKETQLGRRSTLGWFGD